MYSITTTIGDLSIQSSATVSSDYRRAFVGNRRFDMTRITSRAGKVGERYTYTKWIVTERNKDGSLKKSLDFPSDPSTIVDTHKAILKYIAKGN